jgi:hypothetical protein
MKMNYSPKQRAISTLFIGLLLVTLTVLPVQSHSASSKELNMSLHRQHTALWCWGAAIAMVVQFTQRFHVEDCEVLAEYDMRLGGRGLCCVGASECQRGGGVSEMGSIMGNIFEIHGRVEDGALSYDDIVEAIDDDKPIIAIVSFDSSPVAHAIVIAGYRDDNQVVVLDPMLGRRVVDYDSLSENWDGSMVITSDRADSPGCERVREPIMTPFGPTTRPRVRCE